MSRHKTHLDPETGAPFHPLAPAQDACARPEAEYVKKVCKALRTGHPYSGIVNEVETAAADLIETLYLASLGTLTPAASEVERLKDANDYHDHHPLTGFRKPAASEGPTLEDLHYKAEQENQRLREIVNTQADMLRDLRNEVNQALSQVEDASARFASIAKDCREAAGVWRNSIQGLHRGEAVASIYERIADSLEVARVQHSSTMSGAGND